MDVYDTIDDMLSTNKISPIVTELLIRGTKLKIFSLHKSYFAVPKYIRLNSIHYFIISKLLAKRELQQIAFNH